MSQPNVVEKSTLLAVPPCPTLLSAALAGLLCLAVVGCTSDDDGTAETDPSAPGVITSQEIVEGMTEADFTEKCDARGGTVEVMPHCGGFATAKGFSYDQTTNELAEHTCRSANTCGGWNCAIPD
jgi:hypothetical protein